VFVGSDAKEVGGRGTDTSPDDEYLGLPSRGFYRGRRGRGNLVEKEKIEKQEGEGEGQSGSEEGKKMNLINHKKMEKDEKPGVEARSHSEQKEERPACS